MTVWLDRGRAHVARGATGSSSCRAVVESGWRRAGECLRLLVPRSVAASWHLHPGRLAANRLELTLKHLPAQTPRRDGMHGLFDLRGKVALVTGGSKGLGKA
ncbi:MAG: hypothetical protein ACKOJF_01740, partial [Planctomycetaceae bacterium]